MPNHTSNRLEIEGRKEDIAAFIKAARCKDKETGKEIIFSLNHLLPSPAELMAVTSPVRIVSEEEYEKALKGEHGSFIKPLTQRLSDDYKRKFGFDNWYDYRIHNWGTKWDVYDISDAWKDVSEKSHNGIFCHFLSAWSPPSQAIESISENFPNLKFTITYADEGGGYLGEEVYKDGELINRIDVPTRPWDGGLQVRYRTKSGQI